MEKKVKISGTLNLNEEKMFNSFKGNASQAEGIRMMVHAVCDKRYVFPELAQSLLELDQVIKKVGNEIPEKYYSMIGEIIEAEEKVWQILSR